VETISGGIGAWLLHHFVYTAYAIYYSVFLAFVTPNPDTRRIVTFRATLTTHRGAKPSLTVVLPHPPFGLSIAITGIDDSLYWVI